MRIERNASLAILADVLEQVLTSNDEGSRSMIKQLPADLHTDAIDVLSNVDHFVADSGIRRRDETYKEMQETQMRQLIDALRQGESREVLLNYSFLSW